ncbi:hypothetical protein [Bradyrhizobium elkanii]|uniref:hypothetical protein n=1 Tax=Bradyrhizobium elkanii TaxID=29448 RepID=UPI002FEF47FA
MTATRQLVRLQGDHARQGFRLLGVAIRTMAPDQTNVTTEDEAVLTLVGFCAFADPPKRDAADSVRELRHAASASRSSPEITLQWLRMSRMPSAYLRVAS